MSMREGLGAFYFLRLCSLISLSALRVPLGMATNEGKPHRDWSPPTPLCDRAPQGIAVTGLEDSFAALSNPLEKGLCALRCRGVC